MDSNRNSNNQLKKVPSLLPLVSHSNITLGLSKSSAWGEIQVVVFEVKFLPWSAP